MFRLLHFVFDYTGPVEFTLHGSVETSVKKLSEAIHQPTIGVLLAGSQEDLLVGQASRGFVKLFRLKTSLKGDVFKPYFYGQFIDRRGATILSGRFTMQPVWKALLGLPVLVFAVVGILLAVVGLGGLGGPMLVAYVVGGPLLIVVAFGFVFFVKWLFRADVSWLSKRIEDAMQ
jgi:hypothetical protein